MNATMSKQEERQERIAYCANHLSIKRDCFGTFAVVSSATDRDNTSYRVDIDTTGDEPTAKHCSCPATIEKCVHYEGVNLYYENQKKPEEARRCPGCGHVYSADSDCQPGFCLWNSHYTEGLRNLEDQRRKQTPQQEEVTEPVATPDVEQTDGKFHVRLICPGCGSIYGRSKDDNCALGFCYWNSFWTEARRKEQDELVKSRDSYQNIKVRNNFSWRAAS